MKSVILCVGLLASFAISSQAQTRHQKKQAQKHKTVKPAISNSQTNAGINNSHTTFVSLGSYHAKASLNGAASVPNRLQISDPIIRTFNARAYGYDTTINRPAIIGMPKHAYGMANGHLLFRSTDATTSGTSTGSGAVGTGSSPGSIGTSGQAIGVNGKSPYSDPGIWGTRLTQPGIRISKPNVAPITQKQ